MSKYRIAFFSGTGCTALAASCLKKAFMEHGCEAALERIAAGKDYGPANSGVLILMYPLHAFNAPWPVLEWIENLGKADGTPATVISVSGGGDICPNTAGRARVIKMLENKGYDVFFEDSLVMPSNISVATPEPLGTMLIQVLPDKTRAIAAGIMEGVRKRVSPPVIDRFFSMVGKAEGHFSKKWGKSIKVSDICDCCGLCAKQCSTGNITIWAKPEFGDKCCMCFGCVYVCPKGALKPKTARSMIIKDFNLKELEQKALASGREVISAEVMKFRAGYMWSGIKKYLSGF